MSKRNEPSTNVTRVAPPSWMDEEAAIDKSVEGMSSFRVLPRLKVVQALSNEAFRDAAGDGGVILVPGGTVVCRKGETFLFVPLLFWAEYCKWKDLRDKSGTPVLDRSMDPSSELARRASDSKLWEQEYAGGPPERPFKYRYVEHLTFAGVIYGDHPLCATECCISFERGENWNGRGFIAGITQRRVGQRQVPLWCQVWAMTPRLREKGSNKWYGVDASAPIGVSPWIREDERHDLKAAHVSLKEFHAKNQLTVVRDEAVDEDEASGSEAAGTGQF